MNKELKKIALNRLNIIVVKDNAQHGEFDEKFNLTFRLELLQLWFDLKNFDILKFDSIENKNEIFEILTQKKWWDVDYIPLFLDFPNHEIEQNEFFYQRARWYLLHFLENNFFDEHEKNFVEDEKFQKISHLLFDISKFWAEPITEFQTREIFENAKEKQKFKKKISSKSLSNFLELEIVTETETKNRLQEWFFSQMYSKVSVPLFLYEDLELLLAEYETEIFHTLIFEKIYSKELKSIILKFLWQQKNFEKIFHLKFTATDFLRMFALLTGTSVDLNKKICFPKFQRSERKFLLDYLNSIHEQALLEDIFRYRGLWLKIFKSIHIFEYFSKNPKKYLGVEKIVQKLLRNDRSEIFNSLLEKYFQEKNFEKIIKILKNKPGIFARKIFHILKIIDNPQDFQIFIRELKNILWNIETFSLLVLEKYTKNYKKFEKRFFNLKNGNFFITKEKRWKIPEIFLEQLEYIFHVEILKRFTQKIIKDPIIKGKFDTIYLSKKLEKYPFPYSTRNLSDWMLVLHPGSKIDVTHYKKDKNILRLFVYWHQKDANIDLDLSAVFFDKNYQFLDAITYYNLKNSFAVHSWDVRDGLYWASEFIDIDLGKIEKNFSNMRYISLVVMSFTGTTMDNLQKWYFGYSFRHKDDSCSDIRYFDILNVDGKFDINRDATCFYWIVYDIKNHEIIINDFYRSGDSSYYNVQVWRKSLQYNLENILTRSECVPSIFDVLKYYFCTENIIFFENASDIQNGINENVFIIDEKITSELNPYNIRNMISKIF